MGRMCAWCGTMLRGATASAGAVSHGLCGGCLEDLRGALRSAGIRLGESRLHRPAG